MLARVGVVLSAHRTSTGGPTVRWAVRLLACAAAAALVAVALARSPGRAGGGLHEPAGPTAPPHDLAGAWADPDAGLRYLHARFDRKLAIVRDLAEGRATLFEAAARLRGLDREAPPLSREAWPRPWLDGPASEEERCCRDVLWTAKIEFGDRPDCRGRLDDWESELEWHLAGGTVRLPDSP
jgi:hypothetical protein